MRVSSTIKENADVHDVTVFCYMMMYCTNITGRSASRWASQWYRETCTSTSKCILYFILQYSYYYATMSMYIILPGHVSIFVQARASTLYFVFINILLYYHRSTTIGMWTSLSLHAVMCFSAQYDSLHRVILQMHVHTTIMKTQLQSCGDLAFKYSHMR